MHFEECMRTTFPSSAASGHPLSPVRRREGRSPVPDCNRTEPRPAFRRCPAKDNAIPQTGMPSTASDPRDLRTRDCSPARLHASVPRSRRPHVFPWLGKGAFTGLASTTVRSPAIRGVRETGAFFTSGSILRSFVPGTDDPSAPAGSSGGGRFGADCSARAYAGRSASTASTTESPQIGRAHV